MQPVSRNPVVVHDSKKRVDEEVSDEFFRTREELGKENSPDAKIGF